MKFRGENLRTHFVYILFCFLFLSLALRLAHLQIIKKDLFKSLAQNQHLKIIPLKGERGKIFDCKSRVLATNINFYSVYADPKLLEDKTKCAQALAEILNLDSNDILDKLNKNSRFVWIKRKIPPHLKSRIEKLKIKGIDFIKDEKRFYPQGELAAHVLGGVNIDNEGIEGIELFYDNFLKGKDGLVSVMRDSTSNNLFLSPQILEPQKGLDIFLTIDAQIQYWAESYLKETIENYSAKGGSVVVIRACNGEILALANYPTFNPNHISEAPKENIRNVAVTDLFEPGSVFKIVSLIGAVDRKIFSLEDKIFCEEGKFKIPGTILHDWKPYASLTFKEVFKKSSNIGVAKIATTLGPEALHCYIKRLGFGHQTGIDLPGESQGLLRNLNNWSKTSSYIIPIGQEIGVTSVQLARLVCSIANGGYLVRPHLLKKMVGGYGFVEENPTRRTRAIRGWVAHLVKNILVEVVDDGTGKRAKIEEAIVGGKTGTAQKYDFKIGRYSSTQYRATFAGFVEQGEDSFVICVTIDEPRKSHFGGVVAAPLFKKIAEKLIVYLGTEKEVVMAR